MKVHATDTRVALSLGISTDAVALAVPMVTLLAVMSWRWQG